MYKKILIPFLAVAAMSACSKNEITDSGENKTTDVVSFTPIIDPGSRGAETTPGSLQGSGNKDGFMVVAYGNNAIYFHRQQVKWNQADGNYQMSNKYYWPSFSLTFAAWHPVDISNQVLQPELNTSNGTVTTPHKIKDFIPEVVPSEQKDIVIARAIGSKSEYGKKEMPLNFRHILSQIEIRADKEGEQLQVEIAGIELRNIPSKGTFTFPRFTTESDISSGNNLLTAADHWALEPTTSNTAAGGHNITETANSNLQRYAVTAQSKDQCITLDPNASQAQSLMFEAAGKGGKSVNNFMLIPQNFNGKYWTEQQGENKANGAYLSILLRLSQKSEGEHYTQIYPALKADNSNDGHFAWAAVGLFATNNGAPHIWEPGKHYIYTLHFTDDAAGKKDPRYPDEVPEIENLPVEVDPTPDDNKEPGEDLLGEFIRFSVTIDAWQENNKSVEH